MKGPAFTEMTCRHCGQVERRYRGLAALWRGSSRPWCRMCGTEWGEDAPKGISRIEAPINYFFYYFMNAFVWAAIVAIPLGLVVGGAEHGTRQTVVTLALVAGGAFGVYRAEKQRRKGEILNNRSRKPEEGK